MNMNFSQRIEWFRLNSDEFIHLSNQVYLDHAANAIYMNSLIKEYSTKLTNLNDGILFSNPHSHSQSGAYTKNFINSTREKLLKLFNTSSNDYDVVFVQNSTYAFKLLAECFSFNESFASESDNDVISDPSSKMSQIPAVFAYLNDNHTSVIGMRSMVSKNTSHPSIYSVHEKENVDISKSKDCNLIEEGECRSGFKNNNLFVYPAQSNFNGRKYSFDLIEKIQQSGLSGIESSGQWFVCLDTASYVSTSELDLTAYKPDFLVASFYKIFGFPTGLGCLLIRKSDRVRNSLKNKKYFGGGTINSASIDSNLVFFKQTNSNMFHEFLEDGTISYLDIVALSVAIDKFNQLTLRQSFKSIRLHLEHLSEIFHEQLKQLKHYNGASLVEIYRKPNAYYGPIITFNLKDSRKKYISFNLVDKLAQQNQIHFRTGCFCNIGACQMFMPHLKLNNNFYEQGHKCGDHIDLVNGLPTGAIRVSLGYCSIQQDIDLFVKFLNKYFIDSSEPLNHLNNTNQIKLKHQYFKITSMFIYPVKSCAPMRINDSWPIKSNLNGFIYDRNWILIDSNNIPLTQKRVSNLVKIKPLINLNTNTLELKFERDRICLDLNETKSLKEINVYIYPNNIRGLDEGELVNLWLKKNLKLNDTCRLVRILNCPETQTTNSFYTKESYLLVNERSVSKLNSYSKLENEEKLILQFRPNIVVQMLSDDISSDDTVLFEEEFWTRLNILNKNIEFEISDKCNRCQMININQQAETKSSSDLSLLKDLYKLKSDSKFGVYLSQKSDLNEHDFKLEIGDIGTAFF